MGGMHWFILIVVLLAGLAFYNWQNSQNQLSLLKKQGFTLSEDLKGQPNLLVDIQARELAVVTPKGFQRYHFDRVQSVELRFENGVQQPENYHLYVLVDGASPLEIHYENEWLAQDQLNRLHAILP